MKTIEKLQLITYGKDLQNILAETREFLNGGGKWVQLRMKKASLSEVIEVGYELIDLCKQYDAKLIVNDYPEAAMVIGANGVHLGKNDMSVAEARKHLGPNMLIGATANTLDDIMQHIHDHSSYVGLGPFRFTPTKKNLSPVLGLEGIKDIINELKKMNYQIPIVAIGGIGLGDIPELMNTGIHGIAMSSGICNATCTADITKAILALINYQERTKQIDNLTQINPS